MSVDLPPQIRLAREYSCTAIQKYVAKCSGLDTVGSAVEQPDSDSPFQCRDAARHGGLGEMQGLRGSRVVAEARQGECVLDEPEFDHDTRSVSISFVSCIGRIPLPSVQVLMLPRVPTAGRDAAKPMINGLRRPDF